MAKKLIFPAFIFGSVLLGLWLFSMGISFSFSALAVIAGVMVVLTFLERKFPHRVAWIPEKRTAVLDVQHTLLNSIFFSSFAKGVVAAAVTSLGLKNAFSPIHGLNFWIQLAIALLAADLFVYGLHRWFHRSDLGWKIHAVHHSIQKMHFWAAARSHPFNVIVITGAEVLVLEALGVSTEAILAWTLWMSVNGLLQHCNLSQDTRFFDGWLSTAAVHRIHHSKIAEIGNHNFGTTTMVWDRIFGTYLSPLVQPEPSEMGIQNLEIRSSYRVHLRLPFRI
ncbi:MAG: sterol desaturase family protein [Bdellovibrionales bacterium]|nr:sterol desaturase family protein [Bdellovibrionales bacterium]